MISLAILVAILFIIIAEFVCVHNLVLVGVMSPSETIVHADYNS